MRHHRDKAGRRDGGTAVRTTGGTAADAKAVTLDSSSPINLLLGKFTVKFGTEQSLSLQVGTYRDIWSHVMSEVKAVKDGSWIGGRLNETYQFSGDLRATLECNEVVPPTVPEYKEAK